MTILPNWLKTKPSFSETNLPWDKLYFALILRNLAFYWLWTLIPLFPYISAHFNQRCFALIPRQSKFYCMLVNFDTVVSVYFCTFQSTLSCSYSYRHPALYFMNFDNVVLVNFWTFQSTLFCANSKTTKVLLHDCGLWHRCFPYFSARINQLCFALILRKPMFCWLWTLTRCFGILLTRIACWEWAPRSRAIRHFMTGPDLCGRTWMTLMADIVNGDRLATFKTFYLIWVNFVKFKTENSISFR